MADEKYYAIIGGYTGEVIGYCPERAVADVAREEPKATLREVSREEYLRAVEGDAAPDEVSDAAAIVELRQMWPGCSFEIASYINAGFHKAPTRHVEIGVISSQYEVHERWRGATLTEAVQKARDFYKATQTPAPDTRD